MLHTILWIIIILVVGGWLLGLFLRVAGFFIHILLILAVILIVLNLIGRF